MIRAGSPNRLAKARSYNDDVEYRRRQVQTMHLRRALEQERKAYEDEQKRIVEAEKEQQQSGTKTKRAQSVLGKSNRHRGRDGHSPPRSYSAMEASTVRNVHDSAELNRSQSISPDLLREAREARRRLIRKRVTDSRNKTIQTKVTKGHEVERARERRLRELETRKAEELAQLRESHADRLQKHVSRFNEVRQREGDRMKQLEEKERSFELRTEEWARSKEHLRRGYRQKNEERLAKIAETQTLQNLKRIEKMHEKEAKDAERVRSMDAYKERKQLDRMRRRVEKESNAERRRNTLLQRDEDRMETLATRLAEKSAKLEELSEDMERERRKVQEKRRRELMYKHQLEETLHTIHHRKQFELMRTLDPHRIDGRVSEALTSTLKPDRATDGVHFERLKACPMCQHVFKEKNLVGTVTWKQITDVVDQWGASDKINCIRGRTTNTMYDPVSICAFCMQFFPRTAPSPTRTLLLSSSDARIEPYLIRGANTATIPNGAVGDPEVTESWSTLVQKHVDITE